MSVARRAAQVTRAHAEDCLRATFLAVHSKWLVTARRTFRRVPPMSPTDGSQRFCRANAALRSESAEAHAGPQRDSDRAIGIQRATDRGPVRGMHSAVWSRRSHRRVGVRCSGGAIGGAGHRGDEAEHGADVHPVRRSPAAGAGRRQPAVDRSDMRGRVCGDRAGVRLGVRVRMAAGHRRAAVPRCRRARRTHRLPRAARSDEPRVLCDRRDRAADPACTLAHRRGSDAAGAGRGVDVPDRIRATASPPSTVRPRRPRWR